MIGKTFGYLTREDIMLMSEDEINLHIARDIMKENIRKVNGKYFVSILRAYYEIEEYTKDLNLCYQVEVKIKEIGMQWRYISQLINVMKDNYNDNFDLIHASPIDRMRAALLCLI